MNRWGRFQSNLGVLLHKIKLNQYVAGDMANVAINLLTCVFAVGMYYIKLQLKNSKTKLVCSRLSM